VKRSWVVAGIVVAFAAALAVVGAGSRAPLHVSGSGVSNAESPEAPAVYMALKESSGKQLTTAMFKRAQQQAVAMPVSTGTWTDLGPTDIGGRITDLVVDSAHPDTIFVAAAGGGIWKSADRGLTYSTAWPDSYPQAIGALARGSDGTLWAGTGEANPPGGGLTYFGDGIYKSTDNGASWQFSGLPDSGSFGRIVVDSTNPNRIFAAASGTVSTSTAQRGIYRSLDGGATWVQVLAPTTATTGGVDVTIDPTNPNKLFAAMWDHTRNSGARTYGGVGSGLYLSLDGGDTWTRIQNIVGAVSSYDTSGSGLTVSSTLGRIGVAIAPSDPTRVYVMFGNQTGADKGFYVSNDGGNSFVNSGRPGASSGFEWWFGRVWVDPVNKDRLFAADVNLRLSTNGGATWANSGSVHADQHAMAWDPNVPNRVYLGNDGGVYRSDSNGTNNTWVHAVNEPWNQGYHVDVAADDPNRIVVGLQDNGSNRTFTNGSSTPTPPFSWNSYGGGDGHYVVMDQTNHNFYYACSQGGACARRTDTATTSTNASITGGRHGVRYTTDAPLVIDPNNPLVVYSAGQVLDRSLTRGGSPYTQLSPGSATDPGLPGPIDAAHSDTGLYANLYGAITAVGLAKDPAPGSVSPNNYAQTIYVGTDTGLLYRTSNAGGAWTQITGVPNRWVNGIAVDPADPNHAYVVFSGYREGDNAANIWETHDGTTFTNISGNLPNAPLDAVVYDKPDNIVIVSGDLGVYFLRQPPNLPPSTNWSRFGTNLPNTSVQDIKIQQSTQKLYAMTFGRGVQTIDLPKDASSPITTAQLSPPPSNGWYVHPTVTLAATDGTGAGIYSTQYRLDGGAWQTYTAPFAVTGDGSHTLDFRSTDQAGNEETPGTLTFQIDATAPTTTSTISPPAVNGWYVAPTIALSADDGTGSGPVAIEYSLDGAPFQAYAGAFPATGDGTHSIAYRATDSAGNTEATKTRDFKIDATAPTTSADVTPPPVAGWFRHPTVSLAATDGAGSGVDTTQYRVDGGAWETYAGPFAVNGDGPHAVEFKSSDLAGNAENANAVSLQIDATAPTTTATLTPAIHNGWYVQPTVTLSAADGSGSGVESTEYSLDGGPWQPYAAPFAVTGDGPHAVDFRSHDAAGNDEAAKSTSFQIDATQPTTTSSLSPAAHNGWYVHPTVTLSSGDGSGSGVESTEYALDGGPWTPYAAPFAVTGDGTHTLQYRSTDRAGNTEDAASRTFKIDATIPAISITVPLDGSSVPLGAVRAVSFTCTDGGSDIDTCTGTLPVGAPLDTASVGTHHFTVHATDLAGNERTTTVSYEVVWSGWSGFFSPIGDGTNHANAGSTVPVKFSLGGNFGLAILAAGYPASQRISCTTGEAIGTLIPTSSVGGGLSFSGGQYHYNWKTEKAWDGTCRALVVVLDDNTVHPARFDFR
jgi:hypothetical protein